MSLYIFYFWIAYLHAYLNITNPVWIFLFGRVTVVQKYN